MPTPTTNLTDIESWWAFYRREYENRTWRDYRGILAEVVRYAESMPMLDVGSGFGFLVECARQLGMPASGVEASAAALAESRLRHPLAEFREWHAGTPLPCAPESIGVAVLNQVVDHFTRDENDGLFAELQRVLKPGGTLLAFSPSRHN